MAKQPQAIGTEIGGKISAKSLGFDKPTLALMTLNDRENDLFIFRVLGQAIGLKQYTSKFEARGDEAEREDIGYGLVGMWAVTTNAGEAIEQQGTIFIPGQLHDFIVAAMQGEGDGAKANVAVDVYVRYSDRAGPGYVFVNRTLIEPETNPLDELRKQLGNAPMPALPPPSK